ncbi:hypothetical protein BDV26DRAFT_290949 [Aspergillus bertholletiae]|uniref:Uncharacterized protein n=1 Tax=Aspergillus bertholletiae TaxID=1226010 RepID=A0A5N7BDE4_9EURO|nr:hypothetical protein BDV26DRAFT_290949 [Aspergillus bertholletiae]
MGVQGRLQQNVGQLMSAVCASMNIGMRFADYKATGGPRIGNKTPDMVCLTATGSLRIIGEIKTPWIGVHDIDKAYKYGRHKFRHLLGQIVEYMMLADIRYGFLSTYKDMIFLRQIELNGSWVLQYSRPIKGSTAA